MMETRGDDRRKINTPDLIFSHFPSLIVPHRDERFCAPHSMRQLMQLSFEDNV